MGLSPLFAAAVIFCALAGAMVWGVAYLGRMGERRRLALRMRAAGGAGVFAALSGPEGIGAADVRPAIAARLKRLVARLGDAAKPKSEEELGRINKRFLQAGVRARNAVVVFFGAKALCAGVMAVAALSFQLFERRQMGATGFMLAFLIPVAVGFYLPNLWLKWKVSARKERLALGLPDALDLLVVCVEAGMGLDAAIKRVGEEMRLSSGEISEEFGRLNLELRAGKSRRDALKNLAARTGLDEVNALATLLVQSQKFGANVGQALRVHADSMRAKRSQRAEELAAKLPIKLLFPTICFIFPSLFLVLMGPALIQAYRLWTVR
jgi:tight adherence protein C